MTDILNNIPQVDIDGDKIKRAVKEALDDKAMADLKQQNIDLANQMAEGFTRITTRQDIANGKLMKHEGQIEELTKGEEIINRRTTFWQRNQDKIVWGLIAIGLMIFYNVLINNGYPHFLSK